MTEKTLTEITTKGAFCSECGWHSIWEWNFCPNCGADMREGDENE